MKCPYCGSEKVTSLHGVGGLLDRCTTCGKYFSDKRSHIGKIFDYVHRKNVWNLWMDNMVEAFEKDEK